MTRRQIRYQCFRLQTAETGGPAAGAETAAIKCHMESQSMFDGWENFGRTWDVGETSPMVVVSRVLSLQDEWLRIVEANAKVLVLRGVEAVKGADAEWVDGK